MLDILRNVFLSSIFIVVIGTLAGIFTAYLASSTTRKQKEKRKEIDDAIEAAEKKGEEFRTNLFRTPSTKSTKGVKIAEITPKLKGDLQLLDDVITDQIVQTDLVQKLVRNYHIQAISQAAAQFWFSLIAASAGFAYILYATTLVDLEQWATILNILPGIVIDAVAALFFVQAEKTRQRATELYDRLRTDKNLRISEKILKQIEDKKIKSVAQAQIALHLAGLEQKEFDVNNFIKKPDADK